MTNFQPACYQDLLDGKPIFHRMGGKFVEIVPGNGRHLLTITGETFFMRWRWKGHCMGGGHGYLHIQRHRTETAYRMATLSEPLLFVEVEPGSSDIQLQPMDFQGSPSQGYEKFVATYRSLRRQHQHDPVALDIIDKFGREAAYLRVLDERSAKLEADLVIEKARRSSPRN